MRTMQRDRFAAARPVALETLECRRLMTISPYQIFTDPASGERGIRIIGNDANDVVTITENPAANAVTITATGRGTQTFTNDFEIYDIDTGGGADTVTWRVNSDYDGVDRSISLDLDSNTTGTDRFDFSMNGNFIEGSSNILFEVNGNTGNDTVVMTFGEIFDSSRVQANVDVDGGNDNVTMDFFSVGTLNDATDVSDLDVDVDLGTGTNGLIMSLENVEQGAVTRFNVVGGSGTDNVFTVLDGDAGGQLYLDAALAGGNDKWETFLTDLFDVSEGAGVNGLARFNVNGDEGNDTLIARWDPNNTNARVIDAGHTLDINLIGGNGNDGIVVNLNDSTNTGFELDGRLRVRQDGGLGNDTFSTILTFNGDSDATGLADVYVSGGLGQDAFTVRLRDNSGGAVRYAGGYVIVDGGADVDTLTALLDPSNNVKIVRIP
jgi:hypothetical protein